MSNTAARWAGRIVRGGMFAGGAALALGGMAARQRIAAMEDATPDALAPAEGQFVTIGGFRLYYREAGPQDAPALVLLHGFGSNTVSWDRVIPLLQTDYRLIVPDLIGFGYSARSSDRVFTQRCWAAHVAGLLDHLGIAKATLVGNSMGGAVALQFAWDYPERAERLVLVDAVAGYEGRGGSPAPWLGELLRWTPLGPLVFAWGFEDDTRFRKMLEFMYHDPARLQPDMLAGYLAPRRVRGSVASILAMAATPPDTDLPNAVPSIWTPTLLVWGREDRLMPARFGEMLHKDLPNSRLVWIEDCGHMPQEEQPEAFVAAVREFMAEPASTPDAAARA